MAPLYSPFVHLAVPATAISCCARLERKRKGMATAICCCALLKSKKEKLISECAEVVRFNQFVFRPSPNKYWTNLFLFLSHLSYYSLIVFFFSDSELVTEVVKSHLLRCRREQCSKEQQCPSLLQGMKTLSMFFALQPRSCTAFWWKVVLVIVRLIFSAAGFLVKDGFGYCSAGFLVKGGFGWWKMHRKPPEHNGKNNRKP